MQADLNPAAFAFAVSSPLRFLERVGRMAFDLGFEGFLNKFEEHLGPTATTALLIVVGLGVTSVCVGALIQWVVIPLSAYLEGAPLAAKTASLATVFLGFFVAALLIASKIILRKSREIMAQTQKMAAEVSRDATELRALGAEMLATTKGQLDEQKAKIGVRDSGGDAK
jgi:hypothetical protein